MSDRERNRELRAWVEFAMSVGMTLWLLYLLVPAFRFWVHSTARELRRPWDAHKQRQRETRAMMADVVELVAAGAVPSQWVDEGAGAA